jgi:TP901 family phage tail tape measure protein
VSDRIQIQLRALLEGNQQDIEQQIRKLSSQIKERLELKLKINASDLQLVNNEIEKTKKNIDRTFETTKTQLIPKDVEYTIQRVNNQLDRLKVNKDKVFKTPEVSNEVTRLKELEVQFRNGTISSKEYALQMDNVRTKTSQVAGSFKNVAHDGYGFIEMISLAAKKIAIWGISTTLIYNNLRKLREALTFLKDLDKDLTEVSMITGMTRDQTRDLALEYANLGREMGKTVQEISAVNKELLRQGLSIDVAKERMDAIIKLSATARISADESLKIITSSVNAMGETSEKTSDVLLKAGMTSASSASQIGEAFTKTASSARATGMTIEETASILATMIEVTQESPSSLGNSMKTLLARFNKVNEETGELNEELNLVQRAFESVNVKFLDSAGQIRNVGGLLSDLNEKWGTLDKNTKMYIATQAAGVRQQNRFLAIMDNYNRVQEIQNELVGAAGTTNEQYAAYLNSVEAAANRAKVAFEQMWIETLNSDVIREFYNMSTGVTDLVRNIGLLKVVFSALVTILIMSSSAFKSLTLDLSTNIKTMGLSKAMATSLSTSMGGLAVKTTLATTAVKVLYATLTFGLSLAITGTISLLSGLIASYNNASKSVEDHKRKVEDMVQSYDKLKSEIEELKKIESPTPQQRQYIEFLERELKIQEKLLGIEKERLFHKEVFGKGVFGKGLEGDIEKSVGLLDLYIKEMSKFQKQIDSTNSAFAGDDKLIHELTKPFIQGIEGIKRSTLELEKELISQKKSIQSWIDDLGEEAPESLKKLSGEIDIALNRAKNINPVFENSQEAVDGLTESIEEHIKSSQELERVYNSINKSINDFYSDIKDLTSVYNDLNNGEKISEETIQKLIQTYPQYASQLKNINNSKESGIELTKILFEIEKQKSIEKLKNDKLELQSELDKLERIRQAYVATYQFMRFEGTNYGQSLSELTDRVSAFDSAIDILRGSTLDSVVKKSTSSTGNSISKSIDKTFYALPKYKAQIEDIVSTLGNLNSEISSNQDYMKMSEAMDDQEKTIELAETLIEKRKEERVILHETANTLRNIKKLVEVDFKSKFNLDIVNLEKQDIDRHSDNLEEQLVNLENRINKTTDNNLKNSLQSQVEKIKNDKTLFDTLISAFENVNSEIKKLGKEWVDSYIDERNLIKKINDIYKKQEEEIKKLEKERIDALKKQEEERLRSIESIEDKVVQIIRNKIQEEMKVRRDSHNEKIKMWNDEKKQFQDVINEQIKLIDELENQTSYEEELSEKTKEKMELQNKINVLMLDDSLHARNERSKLEDELGKKERDISKFTHKYGVDQRKNALKESLILKEQEIDSRIQKENEELEVYELIQNKRLEKDQIYAEAHTLLMEKSFDYIKDMIIDFEDRWGEGMRVAGEGIKNNIIKNLETVENLLDKIGFKKSGTSASNALKSVTSSVQQKIIGNQDLVWVNQGVEGRRVQESVSSIEARQKTRFINAKTEEERERIRRETQSATGRPAPFANEGYTGSWLGGGGKLALLHPEEFVLNKDTVSNMLSGDLKTILPKINMPNTAVSQSNGLNIKNLININGNVDNAVIPKIKEIADEVVKEISSTFKRRGLTRPI